MPGTNQLADPASFSEWVRERVRYSDTDMQGHVNNLAYLAYAETGRSLLLSTGPVAATLAASGGGAPRAPFLLARVEVDFLGETRWPGAVDIILKPRIGVADPLDSSLKSYLAPFSLRQRPHS